MDVDLTDGQCASSSPTSSTSRGTTWSAGDDAAIALLEHQSQIVRDLLPSCGRVVKELGDGIMIWVPDARSALETCLAVQARVTEQQHGDDPTFVRIGGHWGTPCRGATTSSATS